MSAAALVLALLASSARAGDTPLKPSRAPQQKCAWARLTSHGLGVDLLYEKCDFGYRTVDYVSSSKDKTIYEVLRDTAPGSKPTTNPVIQVFAKKAEESFASAVGRVAKPGTPADRLKHCRAAPAKDVHLPSGHLAFVFAPDDEEAIVKKSDGVPDPPCGPLGMDFDSQSYFEFHPSENPKRFLFVNFGQEEHPGFDEVSLRLLPTP